jgi:hypothetical protein
MIRAVNDNATKTIGIRLRFTWTKWQLSLFTKALRNHRSLDQATDFRPRGCSIASHFLCTLHDSKKHNGCNSKLLAPIPRPVAQMDAPSSSFPMLTHHIALIADTTTASNRLNRELDPMLQYPYLHQTRIFRPA